MFVMLSVRTFAVCERKAEKGTEQQKQQKVTTPTLLIDDLLLIATNCNNGISVPANSSSPSPNSPPKYRSTITNNTGHNNNQPIQNNRTSTNTTTTILQSQLELNNQHQQKLIDGIYANNNTSLIGNSFTKSISFDKNLNKDTLRLTELNNFKHPPAVQVNIQHVQVD